MTDKEKLTVALEDNALLSRRLSDVEWRLGETRLALERISRRLGFAREGVLNFLDGIDIEVKSTHGDM